MKTKLAASNAHKKSERQERTLKLNHRLTSYTMAAGAALAGAAAAEADIVVWSSGATTPMNGSLYFDFNAGGVQTAAFAGADFRLTQRSYAGSSVFVQAAHVFGLSAGDGAAANFSGASQFAYGDPIFTSRVFKLSTRIAHRQIASSINTYFSSANWFVGDTGFLGLKFTDGTGTHYGWAELMVNDKDLLTLLRFGYETNPDQLIDAGQTMEPIPEPSTIALVALGGIAAAHRRKKSKAAA
jgi:PEP-CTERM motif